MTLAGVLSQTSVKQSVISQIIHDGRRQRACACPPVTTPNFISAWGWLGSTWTSPVWLDLLSLSFYANPAPAATSAPLHHCLIITACPFGTAISRQASLGQLLASPAALQPGSGRLLLVVHRTLPLPAAAPPHLRCPSLPACGWHCRRPEADGREAPMAGLVGVHSVPWTGVVPVLPAPFARRLAPASWRLSRGICGVALGESVRPVWRPC